MLAHATAVELPSATREAILDAATRRFAERGFEGTPVRDIAADAGLKNQASLYHYYPDKRALYEAVLARGVASIVELVAESDADLSDTHHPAPPDPAAHLDGVIDYLIAHPYLARLIQGAGHDASAFVRDALPGLLQPLYEEGMRVLSRAGGRWEPEDVPHLAAALYHLIFGYFANPALMSLLLGDDPQSTQALARQRRFLKAAIAQLAGDTQPVLHTTDRTSARETDLKGADPDDDSLSS